MKDELHDIPFQEFISLNPKVYRLQLGKLKDEFRDSFIERVIALNPKENGDSVKADGIRKLKGVSKAVVKHELDHTDYDEVLKANSAVEKNVTSLRSLNHQLYTIQQKKIALTAWYDKMAMLDRIHCAPFGYKGKIQIKISNNI